MYLRIWILSNNVEVGLYRQTLVIMKNNNISYKDQKYTTFERTGDIYALFYERGMNMLDTDGLLCYITSNKWMRAKYGESLRRYFSTKIPLQLIDLGPGVFDAATVDVNILLIQNKKSSLHQLKALTLKDKEKVNYLQEVDFTILDDLCEDSWIILSVGYFGITAKISRSAGVVRDNKNSERC